ncbi:MAG: cystathionine gamma-synthase family protein [Nitrososphaeria archaeon]
MNQRRRSKERLHEQDFSTNSVHGHDYYDRERGLFKVPIYMTSIWEQFDRETGQQRKTDRNVDLKYSREENITVYALEKTLRKLEEAEDSLAFNSGMAALSTIYFSTLSSGDSILITKESYGLTQQLAKDLGKYGVKTILAGPETEKLVSEIDNKIKLAVIETITNPLLKVVDVVEIAKRCSETGTKLVVDNTFATPVLLRPIKHGAWLSMNSLTKYIAGHNDVIGGSIASDSKTILQLWEWRKKLGNIMNPFEAFLVLRALPTLKARFIQQSKTAEELAKYLRDHDMIEEVFYPGLKDNPYHSIANRMFYEKVYGGVLSFKIKGDKDRTLSFMRNVRIIKSTPSLGGVESLATYPIESAARGMTEEVREELGITENLIRLSVGLEEVEDLKADIDNALR